MEERLGGYIYYKARAKINLAQFVHTLEAYVKGNLRISREELAHKMNELVISAQKALISRN